MALDSIVTKIEPSMAGTIPPTPPWRLTPPITAGRNAFEHQAAAEIGLARTGSRGEHERAEGRQQAACDVSKKQVAFAGQAGEARRARVVTDQIERASEHGAIEQQIKQHGDDNRQCNRYRNSWYECAVIEKTAEGVGTMKTGRPPEIVVANP